MDIINAHKTHTFGSQVLAHTSCNSRNKFPWLQAGLCAFLFQALPDSSSAGNKFWADFLVAIVDFLCCTKSLLAINRLLSIGWGWGRWAKHHKAYFTMIKDRRINTNMYIHINLWPLNAKSWLTGKDSDSGKDWGQEEKGEKEDEMVGWHHGLKGHEFEQTPGDSEGQGSLTCCSPWGCKESDTT